MYSRSFFFHLPLAVLPQAATLFESSLQRTQAASAVHSCSIYINKQVWAIHNGIWDPSPLPVGEEVTSDALVNYVCGLTDRSDEACKE